MTQKKLTIAEKAAHRKKVAATLRATLKKSALALEESRLAHEHADLVAAQLEEDAVADHQRAEAEAQDYLSFGKDAFALKDAPKKKSFWERVVSWVNND